ncbi:hypothetical protein ACRQ4B_17575 [Curtobacterium sp. SP.BCo]|uniref:hypothetical protein n=1 Tax=Curtobacterium sp. SP.BCo TaxID=3435229 RepID=UPI003F73AF68
MTPSMTPPITSTPSSTPTPAPSHIVVDLLDHASPTAPWWGVPVIAGIFLVVGAVVTFFATRSNDDRKANRDHQARWHDEIRGLSADAIAAAREVHQFSVDQSRFYSVPDPADQPDADKHIDAIQTQAEAEYAKLLHTQGGLNLVAPASITNALSEMVVAAHVVLIAVEREDSDARADLRPKIGAFIEANRKYLGIED